MNFIKKHILPLTSVAIVIIAIVSIVTVRNIAIGDGFLGWGGHEEPAPIFSGVTNYDTVGINGVNLWAERKIMTNGTTTICSIKSPAFPTILNSFTASFTTGTTTVVNWIFATSTNGYATTTRFYAKTITGTDVTPTLVWVASTTHPTSAPYNGYLPASTYIVVGSDNGTPETVGVTGIAGVCTATFWEVD